MKKLLLLFIIFIVNSTIYGQTKTTLVAVGDIMLAHRVIPFVKTKGINYPFMGTYTVLQNADIAIGNLECPLSNKGTPIQNKEFIFCGDPSMVKSLKFAGFDVFTLANNHILDFGEKALFQTFELLDQNNMVYVGAGKNKTQALEMKVIIKNGIRFGFIGISKTFPLIYYATSKRAGTASLDEPELRKLIQEKKANADIIVVSFHWGNEYKSIPKSYQISFARAAIDSGADIIIGHHPHILQGVEIYKKRPIIYSLGNFAFGSYGKPPERKADYSVIFQVTLNGKKIDSVQLIPLDVFNYRVKFQPQILHGEGAKTVINKMKKYSSKFKTKIVLTNDTGHIQISQ